MKWKVSVLACILHVRFPGAGKGSVSRGSTLLEALRVSEGQRRGAKDLVLLLKLVFPKSTGRVGSGSVGLGLTQASAL